MQADGSDRPNIFTESGLLLFIRNVWPDFSITAEDLRRPTVQFVINFCIKWLTHVQTRTQSLLEMTPEQRNLTDNPEIYLFIMHIINVHKMTMKYFNDLNYLNTRGILDFISPTSKSIKALCGFAANFSAFKEMFNNEYVEKIEVVQEKRDRNQKLKDEIARLETVLHNKRLAKIEKGPSSIETEEENVEVEEKIQKVSNIKSCLSQKINGLSIDHDSAKRTYEETMMQCQKLEDKNAELRNQMIDYPHYQQKLESAQETVKDLDLKIEETQNINKIRENSMLTMESLNHIYENCLARIHEVDDLNNELSAIEEKIKNNEEEVEKLTKDLKEKEVKKKILVELDNDLADNKKSTIIEEKIKQRDVLLKKLEQIQLQEETLKSQYDEIKQKKLEEEKKVELIQSEFNAKKNYYTEYYSKILHHTSKICQEQKEKGRDAVELLKKNFQSSVIE